MNADEKRRLDLTSTYTLAVKSYLATGKDGYDMLNSSNILMDEEEGIMLDTLVRNHFRVLGKCRPKVWVSQLTFHFFLRLRFQLY